MDLERRLRRFTEAGLIDRLPTRAQIIQGELEMGLYVISTDVTEEARYAGVPLSHPLLRQPLIFSRIGLDHLRIGTGMGAAAISVVRHLQFTIHQDMPVWDLQLLQTHEGGLALLRAELDSVLAGRAPSTRSRLRLLSLIFPEPAEYLSRFLGEDGWIARAERMDYPAPSPDGLLPAFSSLPAFMNYVAQAHPERLPLHRVPWLVTRRLREGRGMGWFSASLLS